MIKKKLTKTSYEAMSGFGRLPESALFSLMQNLREVIEFASLSKPSHEELVDNHLTASKNTSNGSRIFDVFSIDLAIMNTAGIDKGAGYQALSVLAPSKHRQWYENSLNMFFGEGKGSLLAHPDFSDYQDYACIIDVPEHLTGNVGNNIESAQLSIQTKSFKPQSQTSDIEKISDRLKSFSDICFQYGLKAFKEWPNNTILCWLSASISESTKVSLFIILAPADKNTCKGWYKANGNAYSNAFDRTIDTLRIILDNIGLQASGQQITLDRTFRLAGQMLSHEVKNLTLTMAGKGAELPRITKSNILHFFRDTESYDKAVECFEKPLNLILEIGSLASLNSSIAMAMNAVMKGDIDKKSVSIKDSRADEVIQALTCVSIHLIKGGMKNVDLGRLITIEQCEHVLSDFYSEIPELQKIVRRVDVGLFLLMINEIIHNIRPTSKPSTIEVKAHYGKVTISEYSDDRMIVEKNIPSTSVEQMDNLLRSVYDKPFITLDKNTVVEVIEDSPNFRLRKQSSFTVSRIPYFKGDKNA